ncbi:hypothetical protein [Deinococcus yunweiensis]|uniref:hypothetical protein n=1 Tax=Deinococcus yunweiensis TaxID=367282 RepID=UPI00398E5852
MRSGYDKGVTYIQGCQAEGAVAEIGHAVVRDVRAALRASPDLFTDHIDVLTRLIDLARAQQRDFVLDRLPPAPNKTSEVLRRSLLALTITVQFRGEQVVAPWRTLLAAWLTDVAEYEILARLEVTSESGEERSTDCMVETLINVRNLLRQAFERLAAACATEQTFDQLTWVKPEEVKPDGERPAITRMKVPVLRPTRGGKK